MDSTIKHMLRVGIDFDLAKRDISDFGAYSAKVAQQLATNVANATRTLLAQGAAGGTVGSNLAAGSGLAEIRREIPIIKRELEAAFRSAGHALALESSAFTKDIDNLLREGRKGFNRAQIGGLPIFSTSAEIPVSRQGLLLPSLKQGAAASDAEHDASTRAAQAGATGMIEQQNSARQLILEELLGQVAIGQAQLADLVTDAGLTKSIAASRVRLSVLTAQQQGIQARALAEQRFAQESALTIEREKVATARNELALTQANPALIARVAAERAQLANILQQQKSVEARALAAANLRLGYTSKASNLGTGGISDVSTRRLAGGDPNVLASINQSMNRAFAVQQAAATQSIAAARVNQTRFQQLYNYLHTRSTANLGGTGAPTLGRFLGSRALSTASFALAGGALYGGISFARNLIKEASELQVQLGITESVFQSFEGTVNGVTFDDYKRSIIDISRETGVSADVIASISRQLAGTFANIQDGVVTPDFKAGEDIANLAVKLSKISGLPQQEIADAFSASVLAFTDDGESATDVATRLGDAVVGLEARFGTSTTEVLNFTASLAPLASEMGFSLEQLTAFGAVVEQALGSDVAAAENIGRIFASLTQNIGPLADLLRRGGIDPSALLGDLGSGDLPAALIDIVNAYDQIEGNDALKQQIGQLIGGERNARTFFAVLDRGDQILSALGTEAGDFDGQFDKRWDGYADKVQAAFERMHRAVEEFGLVLFDAGLVDALLALAQAGETVADVGNVLLQVFSAMNDIFGGLPAKILVAAAALKIMALAGGFLFGRGAGGAAKAGLGTRAGQFLSPAYAGFFSPYSTKASVQGFQPYTGIPIGSPTVDPRIGQYRAPQYSPVQQAGQYQVGGLPYAPTGRVDAKYGLRGLAAGNAGKAGQMFAGAVGTLAPIAATIAVGVLISEMQSIAQEGDAARSDLRSLVKFEIDKGVSPAEIRRRVEGRKGAENDFGTDITNAVTSGFGFLGDSKNSYAISIDEAQKAEKESIERQLEILQESGRLRGNEDLIGFIEAYGESDGTNDRLNSIVLDLIAQARVDDPELNDAFNRVLAGEADKERKRKETAAVLDEVASGELAASVAELELLFETGDATLDELVDAYEEQAALERQAYVALRDSQPDVALQNLQASIQHTNAARDVALKDQKERFERAEAVVGSITGDDPEALLDVKRREFAETTDKDERLNIALEIRDLQQQVLNEEADLLESTEAQIALLTTGFKADPSAAAILVAQVSEIEPEWVDFLNATFGSVEAAGNLIEQAAERAVRDGITMAEALFLEINSAVARARAALPKFYADLSKVYNASQLADIAAYSQALIDQAEGKAGDVKDAGSFLPPIGGGFVTDPAAAEELRRQKEKSAADEARREAEARANAELDVQAARAQGDALALAAIARQRAILAGQFAETTSAKIAAQAQLIEADLAYRDAFVAIIQADRDLAVARSNDDPVKAAQIALQNARDALTLAKGQQARAEAQAAVIRAQRDQRDAILGLADAQTDILIASAEAAGDTVKAAQLSLQKIQRQLARPDLNTQERAALEAERIGAEAGVRDARLAEEKATIDYQLAIGQITKQQALGALQSLLTIPKLTEEQIREINLAIKGLKDQLGQDFRFNLPSVILPTAYEVRRLAPLGGETSGYQDNRTISVQVIAQTNATADDIANAVVQAVGQPNRTGTIAKRF